MSVKDRLQKAKTHRAEKWTSGKYKVVSGSSNKTYQVVLQKNPFGATCTCPWGTSKEEDKRSACSHVLSVFRLIARQRKKTISIWNTEEKAKKQHQQVIAIGDGAFLTLKKITPRWRLYADNRYFDGTSLEECRKKWAELAASEDYVMWQLYDLKNEIIRQSGHFKSDKLWIS